jgi:L-asparaginase II
MQALPLVESGAADAYGFGDKELALACSSHNGEDEHVALAARNAGARRPRCRDARMRRSLVDRIRTMLINQARLHGAADGAA